MNNNFLKQSKYLLLKLLQEPGGFSFFPSLFFAHKGILNEDIHNSFKSFLDSNYSNINVKQNKVNLYIHIPFCEKICSYCNCFKRQLKNKEEIDTYLNYLEKEIIIIYKLNFKKKIKINTIFVWWGTPNLLSTNQFIKLYAIIIKYFNLELLDQFLLDWHPNYYNESKLDYLKSIWVDRLTFAIQTFDNNVLENNNRDIYDINKFEKNIFHLNKIWIKSNIDLLIWLQWQSFDSIKKDIIYLKTLKIDNVSVHYLMNSNNLNYELDKNYLELVSKTKDYLSNNALPNFCSNKTEDYYASKRNSTISLWASAVTNIYSEIIYSKPWITNYYNNLDSGKLPFFKWLYVSKKDEMIKYIYLNILYWVNINTFTSLFWENIFRVFVNEFKFLNNREIVIIKNGKIYSNKTDLETFIYFNIFFIEKFRDFSLNQYNEDKFEDFFLLSWELIDK